MQDTKRIVIKVGSGVIARDGRLDEETLARLVRELCMLRKDGAEVILVTSGAVATGRGEIALAAGNDPVAQKQVLAAVGQVALMSRYAQLFKEQGCACAQILATKEDFRDRQHYLNMRSCVLNLLKNGVVPVVNENDVIAVTELIFTDNDELAGLLASSLDADALIILTSVEGVVKGDPKDPDAEVIPEISFSDDTHDKHVTADRSASGRGGMHTKLGIAKKLAAQGIATHIANGRREGVLLDLAAGKAVGTRFIPDRKLSSVKRRLAHADGMAKAGIVVNECTRDMLLARRIMSLLPVGAVRVEGAFEKGDVIEVRDESGKRLGFGIAQCGSLKASDAAGTKGGRALIHYDHLFIG